MQKCFVIFSLFVFIAGIIACPQFLIMGPSFLEEGPIMYRCCPSVRPSVPCLHLEGKRKGLRIPDFSQTKRTWLHHWIDLSLHFCVIICKTTRANCLFIFSRILTDIKILLLIHSVGNNEERSRDWIFRAKICLFLDSYCWHCCTADSVVIV